MLKKLKLAYLTFAAPLPVSAEREQVRVNVDRFLDLLREAMEGDMPEALADAVRKLAERSDDIERAVVVWVRLIEVLVQNTERGRWGAGQGQLKKADVTAAMHYILSSPRFEIPNLPPYLRPVVIDFAVDWIIEIVVSATNRYDLWASDLPEPRTVTSIATMTIKKLKRLTEPLWDGLARLFARVYVMMRYVEPLSPELRRTLEAVEAEGFFIDKRDFLKAGIETVIFIGNHGPQVIALSTLVFEAVREAERFIDMTGAEKKTYAQDVILTVLGELGFPVDSGLVGMIIRSFVDGAIESAVDLFNRRDIELFQRDRPA